MKIFYSWQSELPNSTNRGFILSALEKARTALLKDEKIEVNPVIDRDTQGIPGSPDIVSTILKKIDEADVFVCDVSLISRKGETEDGKEIRATPNPNVLVELGYALSKLGWNRVITVVNEAFGRADDLPFDLKQKRALVYRLSKEESEKASERNELARALEGQLRVMIPEFEQQIKAVNVQPPTPFELAITAIETASPTQETAISNFMDWIDQEIVKLNPDFSQEELPDELLVRAIDNSEGLVLPFSKVARAIAEINSKIAAFALFKGFEPIIQRNDLSLQYRGSYHSYDFDFFRFLGNELFVTFFSFLIEKSRWELINELLGEEFIISNSAVGFSKYVDFSYISRYVELLESRNRRLGLRLLSLHASILFDRHSKGELGQLVPIKNFMGADLFLLLRSGLKEPLNTDKYKWFSFSTMYLTELPRFLIEMRKAKKVTQFLNAFDITDLITLRTNMSIWLKSNNERYFDHTFWIIFSRFDSQSIGSE